MSEHKCPVCGEKMANPKALAAHTSRHTRTREMQGQKPRGY